MSDMPSCLLQEKILLINRLQNTGHAAPQDRLEPGKMYFCLKSHMGKRRVRT